MRFIRACLVAAKSCVLGFLGCAQGADGDERSGHEKAVLGWPLRPETAISGRGEIAKLTHTATCAGSKGGDDCSLLSPAEDNRPQRPHERSAAVL